MLQHPSWPGARAQCLGIEMTIVKSMVMAAGGTVPCTELAVSLQAVAMAAAGNEVGLRRLLGRYRQLHKAVRGRLEGRLAHEAARAQRLQVCVCVCTCVCTCACVPVSVCARARPIVHACACDSVCVRTRACVCVGLSVHACVGASVCVCLTSMCMCACAHACVAAGAHLGADPCCVPAQGTWVCAAPWPHT